jgi:hypothetical protein
MHFPFTYASILCLSHFITLLSLVIKNSISTPQIIYKKRKATYNYQTTCNTILIGMIYAINIMLIYMGIIGLNLGQVNKTTGKCF